MVRVAIARVSFFSFVAAAIPGASISHSAVKSDSGAKKVHSDGKKAYFDIDSKRFAREIHQYIINNSKYILVNISGVDYEQYVPNYEHYVRVNKYVRFAKFMSHNIAPSSAEKCNTIAQLDAWRKRVQAPIYAFIPKEFHSFFTYPIEEKYEQNFQRLLDTKKEVAALTNMSLVIRERDDHQEVVRASSDSDSNFKIVIPDFSPFLSNITKRMPFWKQYVNTNISQFDYDNVIPDYEKYLDIGKYEDFVDAFAKEHGSSSANKCTSIKELDAWHRATEDLARAFIPKVLRSFVMESIDEEYSRSKNRIEAAGKPQGSQASDIVTQADHSRRLGRKYVSQSGASDYRQIIPSYAKYLDVQRFVAFAQLMHDAKVPDSVAACKTKAQLDAWRIVREAPIHAFVPKRWQHLEFIQQHYKQNLKRIQQSHTVTQQTDKESVAIAAPMELLIHEGFLAGAQQFTSEHAQTSKVQELVPSYAKHIDVQFFLSFVRSILKHDAPEKASECKSMHQLNTWQRMQRAIIKGFVPPIF